MRPTKGAKHTSHDDHRHVSGIFWGHPTETGVNAKSGKICGEQTLRVNRAHTSTTNSANEIAATISQPPLPKLPAAAAGMLPLALQLPRP